MNLIYKLLQKLMQKNSVFFNLKKDEHVATGANRHLWENLECDIRIGDKFTLCEQVKYNG